MATAYPEPYTFPTPNYVDPETRGDVLIIVGAILGTVAAVAVGLRFLAHFLQRRFEPGDLLILFAWLTFLGLLTTGAITTSRYGWNRHVWDVPRHWIPKVGIFSWVGGLLYFAAACLTCLSILAFYYRLTENATWTRRYHLVLHIALTWVLILFLISFSLRVFQCVPVNAYWTNPRPSGACRSEARELFSTSAAGTICDFLLLILPIPMIWRLQMSTHKKVQAIALLTVGIFATAAGSVRSYFVWRLFHSRPDTSWNACPIYFSSDVEVVLGIICACAPHIKPLVKKWIGHSRNRGDAPPQMVEQRPQDQHQPPMPHLESWKDDVEARAPTYNEQAVS